jgi:hypothetical protein
MGALARSPTAEARQNEDIADLQNCSDRGERSLQTTLLHPAINARELR